MDSDTSACEQVFDCTQCGDCCRGFGGTYISENDISAICGHQSIDREDFIQKYCARSGSRRVLRQRPDGYCIFWEKLCTIHPVKPRMCRQWPFLKSVLVDEINWRSMGSMCPGIRIEADMDQVRACIEACIQTEPEPPSKL
jgi:Fe-S-cluster containining protein